MRIAVLGGGGAMGGIFGGWLQRSGNDVVLVDVSKDAVHALNDAGLSIDEKDGSQSLIRVRATDDPETVGPVDLDHQFRQMLPHRSRGQAPPSRCLDRRPRS